MMISEVKMTSINSAEAQEINKMLVEDINSFLREKYKEDHIPDDPQKYVIPSEWLFLASHIKKSYRSAGWIVKVGVEISQPPLRDYYLMFERPNRC
jgi:hypothetical protein